MSADAGLIEALRSKLAVAFIVRDEGRYAVQMLDSVRRIAGFVSCLDTGSTDDTPALIARFLDGAGVPYRIDAGRFSRYDEMRNAAIAGVPDSFPWILMLDADEVILERDFAQLLDLIDQDGVDAWDLPRFNWTDRIFGERTEAYPDFQARLFQNPAGGAGPRYLGEVHETLTGFANKQPSEFRIEADGHPSGLHIHHLKLFQKSHAELQAREDSYREIYLRDIRALRQDHLRRIWHGIDPFANAATYAGREDFQGWASDHEWLKSAISGLRPRLAVDVGVWKGGSTMTMAETLREQGIAGLVIAVDTWLGAWDHWLQAEWFPSLRIEDGYPALYRTFMANIAARDLQDYVIPLPLDSINAAHVLRQRRIFPDVVHIDAGHDYDAVTNDLRLWWPMVAEGGMLIGDDYHPSGDTWPEVRRAFQDFFQTTEIENSGGKCRIRKPAAAPGLRAVA